MQQGSVIREHRKLGPDVWCFRWWEAGPNGNRVHRRIVLGTAEQMRDAASARQLTVGLVQEINTTDIRSAGISMTPNSRDLSDYFGFPFTIRELCRRHRPRKFQIKPNPIPRRIRGMIFNLSRWSRKSDSKAQTSEIASSCLKPTTPDGKITAFPRKSVRSRIAPTTTAMISSRTPAIMGLSWVRSTSGAPA